jgi:DNA-binding ferritin-like protein
MEKEIDVNSSEVKKWAIFAGLGGGINSVCFHEFLETTYEDAIQYANQIAEEDYESYVGMYGLRELSTIMEEDDVDEEEAQIIYNEERESWLSYYVEEYNSEKHSQYEE